jgi:cell division protein YceG involved in septum cleavage
MLRNVWIAKLEKEEKMTEETMEHYPRWIPPTYLEEGLFEPSEYSVEDWRQAEAALGDLVQMSLVLDNQALILALWDARDRVAVEVGRARRRARGAA